MPYFMETLEIKNQISQLEIENRRLQINYAKLRKMNLEKLDIIKRNEEYAMIPSEDEEEEEKYVKKASVRETGDPDLEYSEVEDEDQRN